MVDLTFLMLDWTLRFAGQQSRSFRNATSPPQWKTIVKIICKDNFDRESHSESLVAENVNEFYAQHIVIYLNERFSSDSSDEFYVAKPDDYKLYTFEP